MGERDAVLRKSARTYRAMLSKVPAGAGMTRTPEFKECSTYLRELYREFGRDIVRRALGE